MAPSKPHNSIATGATQVRWCSAWRLGAVLVLATTATACQPERGEARGSRQAGGPDTSGAEASVAESESTPGAGASATDSPKGSTAVEPDAAGDAAPIDLGPPAKWSLREHPAGQAWLFEAGKTPVSVPLAVAEARGYTLIDLGDEWVPYIFADRTPGQEDASTNEYAARFRDLANDRADADGDVLAPHQHNYLELYGIPPSLSVVLAEWREAETTVATCLTEAGYDGSVFEGFTGTIAYTPKLVGKRTKRARAARAYLDKQMKKAGVADDLAAAEHPKTKHLFREWRNAKAVVDVVTHAQIRFRCEGLFLGHGGRGKFTPGEMDASTHHALAQFEKKHSLMGWGHFDADNVAMLAKDPLVAAHERLKRTVTERVVSGAGIVEDGSAKDWLPDFRWRDEAGVEHPLPDLVSDARDAVLTAMELDTPERARRSLDTLSKLAKERATALGAPWSEHTGEFPVLVVAVKLPPKPAYHSADMKLSAVIDRGDVWYDFPFDQAGNALAQPRSQTPRLTVYAEWNDQKIPLVHWRTTIGSWRSELHEGREWFAYKNSDVGDRVWKDIMAAPVWIPPDGTPTRDLVTRRMKDGVSRAVVNYAGTGPGYESAYGLVAAYHIRQTKNAKGEVVSEFDNQIRTHGSHDYMSILRRYSHGCHRLYNMNAVRLFSFVLTHSPYVRKGQTRIGYARSFEHDGRKLRIALDTRGYLYELNEPIPVTVTEGRIRGHRQTPIKGYMPKPGVSYDATTPTTEAGEITP
jgi:hypothetical protein